ncbi:hypothetical protein NDU88_007548 [Pleurodeles waltl]|uniref:Uncharacterized protein n=1 Tax=Pleurodeles waltl TaxID=8319 RepID=A0AAV7U100_PLEWA|nr:hypothetical protein NDU88_007548 [Pleurodeles waltl]
MPSSREPIRVHFMVTAGTEKPFAPSLRCGGEERKKLQGPRKQQDSTRPTAAATETPGHSCSIGATSGIPGHSGSIGATSSIPGHSGSLGATSGIPEHSGSIRTTSGASGRSRGPGVRTPELRPHSGKSVASAGTWGQGPNICFPHDTGRSGWRQHLR